MNAKDEKPLDLSCNSGNLNRGRQGEEETVEQQLQKTIVEQQHPQLVNSQSASSTSTGQLFRVRVPVADPALVAAMMAHHRRLVEESFGVGSCRVVEPTPAELEMWKNLDKLVVETSIKNQLELHRRGLL